MSNDVNVCSNVYSEIVSLGFLLLAISFTHIRMDIERIMTSSYCYENYIAEHQFYFSSNAFLQADDIWKR